MGDHLETAGAIFILNVSLLSVSNEDGMGESHSYTTHTHRTEADYDTWTRGCRSYQSSVFLLLNIHGTGMWDLLYTMVHWTHHLNYILQVAMLLGSL